MSEQTILVLMLLLVGVVNLRLVWKFKTDKKFAQNYIKTSPKAYFWRKKFGEERALAITKKYFIPLGSLLSIIFILFGIFLLIK